VQLDSSDDKQYQETQPAEEKAAANRDSKQFKSAGGS